jgi:hypothetical protein
MVLSAAFGFGNALSILVSVLLAFVFGYALTLRPVIAAGVPPRRAMRLAVASDTVSIATMELVASVILLAWRDRSGLADGVWWSRRQPCHAFVLTVPVNRC